MKKIKLEFSVLQIKAGNIIFIIEGNISINDIRCVKNIRLSMLYNTKQNMTSILLALKV